MGFDTNQEREVWGQFVRVGAPRQTRGAGDHRGDNWLELTQALNSGTIRLYKLLQDIALVKRNSNLDIKIAVVFRMVAPLSRGAVSATPGA